MENLALLSKDGLNAREELIKFLTSAPKAENKCYIVILTLTTQVNADAFIHRMRVELSRFRTALINDNKQLKPFKLMVKKINYIQALNETQITLRYKTTSDKKNFR